MILLFTISPCEQKSLDPKPEELLPEGKICDICLVLDHPFINSLFMGNVDDAKRRMSDVIDYVNWVYRSVDWDGDGQPDNFGFSISRV